jgi:hypothetical protein
MGIAIGIFLVGAMVVSPAVILTPIGIIAVGIRGFRGQRRSGRP